MTIINLKIPSGESVTGFIELQKLDSEEDVVERKSAKGLCFSDILETVSNGQLSMGELEIYLDFDEDGKLISLEFHT